MEKPKQFPAFFSPAFETSERTYWRPPVDIYQSRNGWVLKFDLAGVSPEDVRVEVRGGRISVSGIRRDFLAEEAGSYYSMEIAYNRFERTVELPCRFADPHIALESSNGILVIRVSEAS